MKPGTRIAVIVTVSLVSCLAFLPAWAAGPEGPTPLRPVPLKQPPPPPSTSATPDWIKPFRIGPGQTARFPFAVTQQGRVGVAANWQGAPLTVTINDPSGKPVTPAKAANGPSTTVLYNITAADLGKGSSWTVMLTAGSGPQADGKVAIVPPQIAGAVEAQAKAVAQNARARNQADAAKTAELFKTKYQARVKEFNDARTAKFASMSTQLKARMVADLASRSAIRVQTPPTPVVKSPALITGQGTIGGSVQHEPGPQIQALSVSEGEPGNVISVFGANIQPNDRVWIRQAGQAEKMVESYFHNDSRIEFRVPSYDSYQPVEGEVYLQGQRKMTGGMMAAGAIRSGMKKFVFKATRPGITSISIAEGEPLTPVGITGSKLVQPVEVHFKVGPSTDLPGRVEYLNDTQIVAYVPDASGIAAPFDGEMFVRTPQGQTNSVPFRLIPGREVIPLNIEENLLVGDFEFLKPNGDDDNWYVIPSWGNSNVFVGWHKPDIFEGYSGDDVFFKNFRLKNGWLVDSIIFWDSSYEALRLGAKTRLEEYRQGTDSPYLRIRWWADALISVAPINMACYNFAINIVGPKGVPYK